jgi:NTE family protein
MTSKLAAAHTRITCSYSIAQPRPEHTDGWHHLPEEPSQARRSVLPSLRAAPNIRGGSERPDRAVAFVLQGGGSLTATQVGMLRALTEHGIVPDLVVGSSAGALNAVAFAGDPTASGVDQLEELWLSIRRRHVAPASITALLKALRGRSDGLVTNAALRRLLESRLGISTLSQTRIPVHVMATDRHSGRAVILSDGDVVSALLASAAYPGLYPPVRIGARDLIDGGVAADIPVLQAEALGATVSYILPAAVDDDIPARGPLPLAYRALGQILESVSRRDIAAAQGQVLMLPAPTSTAAHPVDFRDTARLITQGYQLTENWLAQRAAPADHATVGPS